MASSDFDPTEFAKFKNKATLDDSVGFNAGEFNNFKTLQPKEPMQDDSLAGRDARYALVNQAVKSGAANAVQRAVGDASTQPFQIDTSNPVIDAVRKAIDTLSLTGPARLSASISQPGQAVGEAAQKAVGPKHPVLGFLANMGASSAVDPQNLALLGMNPAGNAGKMAAEGIEKAAPAIAETLADVPKAATERLMAVKDLFKKYAGSSEAIDGAVEKLQNAFDAIKDKVGKPLNDAKELAGLPVSVEDKTANVLKSGNVQGITAQDLATQGMKETTLAGKLTQPDLLAEIETFKATKNMAGPEQKARMASFLQDQIKDAVDFSKPGTQLEGLLKSKYKELGTVIEDLSPGLKDAKAKMSSAMQTYEDLQKKLGEGPGVAHDFLEKVFTGTKAGYEDIRKNLATLEALSGKPVVTDLFNQFAVSKLNKMVGRPAVLGAGLSGAAAGVRYLNPAMVTGGVAAAAAQSPYLLSRGLQAARGAANVVANPAVSGAANVAGMFAYNEARKKALQMGQPQ